MVARPLHPEGPDEENCRTDIGGITKNIARLCRVAGSGIVGII